MVVKDPEMHYESKESRKKVYACKLKNIVLLCVISLSAFSTLLFGYVRNHLAKVSLESYVDKPRKVVVFVGLSSNRGYRTFLRIELY